MAKWELFLRILHRMIGMNWRSVALIFLLSPCASIFGQESQLVVAKLEAAVYPPMAVAARVWGDVTLHVALASDGTATAVSVESGPPMLRQAAINSATQSLFQSSQENRTGDYRLVYRFVLDQTTKCEHDASYPRVKHESNVVTITEQNVPICDPGAVIERVRFRSAKCLYLWKCGSRTP
jgi:hypothetical protein